MHIEISSTKSGGHRPVDQSRSSDGTWRPGSRLSPALWYLDFLVVIGGAPIALLIGVPSAGYAIGATGWILLRGLGFVVDRRASAMDHVLEQAALRLSYRLLRAALLAGAAVLALKTGGRDDGLAALAVIIAAFTIRLPLSIFEAHAAGWARTSRTTST